MARRILLVDDDEDIRTVGELALVAVGGYEVRTARDAADCMAVARGWQPDVILLDVMMPRTDGPATLALLRSEPALATIPVIFCTARAQTHEVAALLELGACAVIRKPFNPMTLGGEIEACMKDLGCQRD